MNHWFSSDFHLSHYNLMKFLNRPFSSVEEMNATIIDNFYSQVKPGDQVYFLGDLSWNRKIAIDFLSKLPKNIHFHFIPGNHDKKLFKESVIRPYVDSYSWIKDIKVNGQKITLCHYLMLSWNCSHWNAYLLHGHHHKDVSNIAVGKVMNVCVDLHDFKMVEFEEVKEYMKNKKNNWNYVEKK